MLSRIIAHPIKSSKPESEDYGKGVNGGGGGLMDFATNYAAGESKFESKDVTGACGTDAYGIVASDKDTTGQQLGISPRDIVAISGIITSEDDSNGVKKLAAKPPKPQL